MTPTPMCRRLQAQWIPKGNPKGKDVAVPVAAKRYVMIQWPIPIIAS